MAAFTTRATGDTILAADHNEVRNFFELGTTAGIINASHKGASIASAATLTLGTDGNIFHVTGSTGPITAISNPAPGAGTQVVLIFDSTPTLTHSANLYLMGAANYTAVAHDVMVLEYDGSSVWLEVFRNGTVPATSLPLHASRHNSGGADVMAIDAAAGTGSLRTLGTGPTQALPGNTSLAPTGPAGGDLAGTYPNPTIAKGLYNFLTNPAVAIWQRGTGAFTANAAYCADRWQNVLSGSDTNSTSQDTTHTPSNSLYAGASTFVQGNGTASGIRQVLKITTDEPSHYALRGQVVSFSFAIRTATASAVKAYIKTDGTGGTTTLSSFHTGGGTYENLAAINVTVPVDATYVEVGWQGKASATIYWGNAILALTATAPTFSPLTPAEEWGRCQRYYEIKGGTVASDFGMGAYESTSGFGAMSVQWMTRKAVAPAVTKVGTWTVATAGQPSVDGAGITSCRIGATWSGTGDGYFFTVGTTTYVSAESNP